MDRRSMIHDMHDTNNLKNVTSLFGYLNAICNRYGLKINLRQTKYVVITRNANVNQTLELKGTWIDRERKDI